MSGDLVYDPEYKRCINVDARYVLFVIDKFAGAGHLIKEMKIVREERPATPVVEEEKTKAAEKEVDLKIKRKDKKKKTKMKKEAA